MMERSVSKAIGFALKARSLQGDRIELTREVLAVDTLDELPVASLGLLRSGAAEVARHRPEVRGVLRAGGLLE